MSHHEPAIPTPLICDFCYVPSVHWQYHTHEFGITDGDAVFGDTPVHEIQGVGYVTFEDLHPNKPGPSTLLGKNWLACETCAQHIERSEIEALSQRILTAFLALSPKDSDVDPALLREQLQLFCQAFLHQQTTPRTPWPSPPSS